MEMPDVITKVTQTLRREDGSEVRIVVTDGSSPASTTLYTDVFVLRRQTPQDNWSLCNNRPHPDWKGMPREQYLDHGRSEMLQTVTPGEILKLSSLIGKPVSEAPEWVIIK